MGYVVFLGDFFKNSSDHPGVSSFLTAIAVTVNMAIIGFLQ
jgi:hypothetical protein